MIIAKSVPCSPPDKAIPPPGRRGWAPVSAHPNSSSKYLIEMVLSRITSANFEAESKIHPVFPFLQGSGRTIAKPTGWPTRLEVVDGHLTPAVSEAVSDLY
jgi:hypothetical protein